MKTKTIGYIGLMFMLLSPIAHAQNSETVQPAPSESYFSRAGVFIEPLIFYSAEDSSVQSSQLPIINDDTSGNSNGYGLGFRVGGHAAEILLIGLDARYANMKNDDSFYKDADVTVYNTPGLHDVRPTINKREYSVELSDDIIERCKFLNFVMEQAIENYKYK
jgi:hypothetical protein